jgi:F0F1-type ATP synthase membrane subunit b/b'
VITPPDLSLIFIMLCFWAVFFVVSSQIVKPLGRVLDEREALSRGARQRLEEARSALQAAMARTENELAAASVEATRERASMRAEGEATRRARLDAARERSQQTLARLGQDLDQASAEARAGLRASTEHLARELASRLLGRGLRA